MRLVNLEQVLCLVSEADQDKLTEAGTTTMTVHCIVCCAGEAECGPQQCSGHSLQPVPILGPGNLRCHSQLPQFTDNIFCELDNYSAVMFVL